MSTMEAENHIMKDLCGGQGKRVQLIEAPVQDLSTALRRRSEGWIVVVDQGWPQAHRFAHSCELPCILWPGGETTKTRESKAALEDRLLALGIEPAGGLCAVGGGALLDLVGFTAATLFRGVALILCPTTLLSMVDASIGSKNAINLPHGKNLIGTLYDPQAVWWDRSLLRDMPFELYQEGMAEIIKHAVLAQPEQLLSIAELGQKYQDPSVMALDSARHDQLATVALTSLQIKDEVVMQSMVHPEVRHQLNFGHTIGHAIEAASHFSISHGRAVAMGVLVEGLLAHRMGQMSASTNQLLLQALQAWSLTGCMPSWDSVLPFLMQDKKRRGRQILLGLPSHGTGRQAAPALYQRTSICLSHLQEIYLECQPVCV